MEARLFEEGTIPECTTPEWYASRDRAPHLEQPIHQMRLYTAFEEVFGAVRRYGLKTVVDLGAGDGGLLSLLSLLRRATERAWGYDLQHSNIAGAAERGVDVRLGDVVAGHELGERPLTVYGSDVPVGSVRVPAGPIVWGDIAVATEMLEHLIDPHGFVRAIPDEVRVLVASSPVTETAESHYEHHLWCWDKEGYASLIAQGGFEVIHHRIIGPFQVVSAVRP